MEKHLRQSFAGTRFTTHSAPERRGVGRAGQPYQALRPPSCHKDFMGIRHPAVPYWQQIQDIR